ncbi:hypothetical protein [uncultured Akkermansia sp.]|uniref:hypothetical protein n=2 Tax=uncultured Akkermansia sp. TaxID=512294 RepID=UPI0026357E6A|nr:hypothetical protein [uncultured Akkermansia sp.]
MIKSSKIMRKIFLFFVLLFPMSVYSEVNNYQDLNCVGNNFSIKEQEYLRKYVLRSTASLLRAVGNSKYSSSILSDQNNQFILEQSIRFYRKFDTEYLPKIVQEYLFRCFFINKILIDKSKCNYFKTVVLLNEKNAIENQFRNDMKKYGYDWNSILAHFIGKNPRDIMAKLVANSFEKFVNNGTVIDPNDESTMEIVIKNAYIEFANYLDEESQKK